MPGHDAHGSAKRRRTLETLAVKNRSGRAPFGAVDGNTLADRTRQPSSRQGKKSERALSPADVQARDRFEPAPPSPMDAEMDAWDGGEADDAPFGVSESFHEWLTRVGLRGPLDPDRGGTLVSAGQREELQRVWGDAAETETLRRLVENLKDGELEMARRALPAVPAGSRSGFTPLLVPSRLAPLRWVSLWWLGLLLGSGSRRTTYMSHRRSIFRIRAAS